MNYWDEKKNKEAYQLRLNDFIPFLGLRNYSHRTDNRRMEKIIEDSLKYNEHCLPREVFLTFYNILIGLGGVSYSLYEVLK